MIADGQPRRLHPLTLLLALFRLGPQSVGMIPGLLALGVVGRWVYVVPALAAYLALAFASRWLAWARFRWQVDDNDIAITSGIFSRNHRTIPFDRIQDVNISQGPVQRLLGLATVGFETGSAAGGKAEDAALDSIAIAQADALRDLIRAHRAPAPTIASSPGPDAAPAAAEPGRLLFWMTPRRLVLAGLFHFSLAVFAVLFGLLNTLDNYLPFNPLAPDFWLSLVRISGLEEWVALHRWLSAFAGAIAVLLLGLATGLVRTVLADWDFRLERTPRGLRRTRGLLTRTDVVIPVARVQAARVDGDLLSRPFGWFSIRLQSLATDGERERDHLVAPLATLTECDAVLAELGLDRAGLEENHGKAGSVWSGTHILPVFLPPVAVLVVGLVLLGLITAVGGVIDLPRQIAGNMGFLAGLLIASAVLLLALGWFQWSHSRWYFDGRLLHIAHGFRTRSHMILPARNIQSADIRIGPLTRRFGLAAVHLGVPGGDAGGHVIAVIPEVAARTLRATVLAAR